jgi:uncharacterized OB-fold protein
MPVRLLPTLNEYNRAFWTGGSEGSLRLQRCSHCDYYIHPPAPVCRRCKAMDGLDPVDVSGNATVITYTINRHPWSEGQEPYAMALVQLDEQADLRLVTNIVDCPFEDIHIGMRVHAVFEPVDDIFVPVFAPGTSADAERPVAAGAGS